MNSPFRCFVEKALLHPDGSTRTLEVGDIFDFDLPMRWADADALNHLNNANYFRYMEEGRIRMFVEGRVQQNARFSPVVVHCACDFKKPITYPALIRVSHRVERIGRSSMEHAVDLSLVHPDGLELCAQGKSIMVWMDFELNRGHPWPEDVLQALASCINRR
ncbi:MAG: acyl-CoA thioesterase [Burkholderiaceae bacterium]|nr:acyl-CoA thioesterase [Burkholderiaceae bacterium]